MKGLIANLTKYSQQPTNYLSVVGHFVKLALKELSEFKRLNFYLSEIIRKR